MCQRQRLGDGGSWCSVKDCLCTQLQQPLDLYQFQPEELSTQLLLLWSLHFTRPLPARIRRTVNTTIAPVICTLSLDLHQLQPEELSTQLLLLWSLHFYSNSTSFYQMNCQHKSCYCDPHTCTRPGPASTRRTVNTSPAPVIFTLSCRSRLLSSKTASIGTNGFNKAWWASGDFV